MITQELLSYIRSEFSKGKNREEIHSILMANGGWSEDDLNEAFRTIIPMQGVMTPKPAEAARPISSFSSPSVSTPTAASPLAAPTPAPSPVFTTPPVTSFSPKPSFTPSPAPSPVQPTARPTQSYSSSYSPSPLSSPFSSALSSSPVVPSMLKPNVATQAPAPKHSSSSFLKFLIILIIVGGLGAAYWFYGSSIKNYFNSMLGGNPVAVAPVVPAPVVPPPVPVVPVTPPPVAVIVPKDCGSTTAPKMGVSTSYEKNAVLTCLGDSAVKCENAKGVVNDPLFPTIFEISQIPNATPASCYFKLSYTADSTLTDITGQQLATQYVSCPLNIVKTIDNSKPATPKFLVPKTTDLAKYASDIYFYGTLGLFVENNLDINKILNLGCSGSYIQSMIASYSQKKTP